MMNSVEMMQQIQMDRLEADKIAKSLEKLAVLCQKYGIVSQSSDILMTEDVAYELESLNEQISSCLVGIYTRRNALKDGLVAEV